MGLSKLILSFLLIGVISGCVTTSQKVFNGNGLSTGKPGMNTYPLTPPGESITLKRPYQGAPPVVPHNVADFDIDRDSNDCANCHIEGVTLGAGHKATKIPGSHYKNEYTGEYMDPQIVGIRHNCLMCHVPQSVDEPPVY